MNVYKEMQTAIDCAWATKDSEIRKAQIALVGDNHKPTPEELIQLVAQKVRSMLQS